MRRSTVIAALAFAALTITYSWIYSAEPMARLQGDGYYTYLWAVTVAVDGDLDLDNQYRQCGDPWHLMRRRPAAEGQWPHNTWSIGPALVWGPLLAVARVLDPTPVSDDARSVHGCVGPQSDFALFGSVLMGLGAIFCTFLIARRHAGEPAAILAMVGIGLASILPFYAAFIPSYGHVGAAFGAALFLERWDATRGSFTMRRWVLLGVLLGVAMLMRAQDGLLALAPLFEWLVSAREELRKRSWRGLSWRVGLGFVFVGVAFAVFFPQLHVWKHTYGVYFALPQGPYYMRWGEPHLDGVLFGAISGLFTFTPLMYAGGIGLLLAAANRKTRLVGIALLAVLAAYTYVNGAVWDWWGSAGFGARRFASMMPVLGFGIAITAARVARFAERRPRRFAWATLSTALVLFVLWNVGNLAGVARGHILMSLNQRADTFWQLAFAELTTEVHEAVGNPLAWPASIPFALKHGVHPKRYDVVRGPGTFYQEFETARLRSRDDFDHLRPGRGPQFDFALEGWEEEPRSVAGRPCAVTSGRRARLLVPLFASDVSSFDMNWVATRPVPPEAAAGQPPPRQPPDLDPGRRPARVAIYWNDTPLTQVDVPGRWTASQVTVPPEVMRVGVNELVLEIVHGPVAIESIRFRQAPLPPDPGRMKDWFDLNGLGG